MEKSRPLRHFLFIVFMEFTDLDTGLFTKMSREEIVFPSMQRMLLIPEIARLDVVRSELTNMAV